MVDDDTDIVNFICGALEDEGLTVMAAPDGQRAVALSEQFQPDLIVLDVTLPKLSSEVVAARVRELRGRSFPVLVITADGRAAEKARGLGAYAYLRKPFDLNHLIEEVWHGLRRGSGG